MTDDFQENDLAVISPMVRKTSLDSTRRSATFMTSTPLKRKSADDDVTILKVVPTNTTQSFQKSSRRLFTHDVTWSGCSATNKVYEYIKLRKDIKNSYKRVTYRIEKMLSDDIKRNRDPSGEIKSRQRSSSRSRRNKTLDVNENCTPVRRSSRLQQAKKFPNEKFIVDENNNGEKIPNNGFGGCDNSSSAYCVSHPALDVTFHMKKWVQNHPYLDRIAPIILFVIFAVLVFFIVNHFVTLKLHQQLFSTVSNLSQRVYQQIQSFTNVVVRRGVVAESACSFFMLVFALLVSSTMADPQPQYVQPNSQYIPLISLPVGYERARTDQARPPSYVPATVIHPLSLSDSIETCMLNICFGENCCTWLKVPVALWIIFAIIIVSIFVIFLIFKVIQLVGQMREK